VSSTESPRAPHVWTLDDAELIARVRDGDEAAAEILYDRLGPKVEATVTRLLGYSDPDRDDCVQVAYVEIIRTVERFRGGCSLEHWASTIAARVVYKHLRRRGTERLIFHDASPASEPPDAPEPTSTSRRIVARDLARRVRDALQKIAPEKMSAFLLHDVLGFDLREVAEITRSSVAATQQRVLRGRREAHAHLSADAELSAFLEQLDDEL
jgi:RNA polymerase sigma-70 factor, ECF subfamily